MKKFKDMGTGGKRKTVIAGVAVAVAAIGIAAAVYITGIAGSGTTAPVVTSPSASGKAAAGITASATDSVPQISSKAAEKSIAGVASSEAAKSVTPQKPASDAAAGKAVAPKKAASGNASANAGTYKKSSPAPAKRNGNTSPAKSGGTAGTGNSGKNLGCLAEYGNYPYKEGVAWTNSQVRASSHFDCARIVSDLVAEYRQHGYTLETSEGDIYLCNDGMGDIMLRGRCSGYGQTHIMDIGVLLKSSGYIKEGAEILDQ